MGEVYRARDTKLHCEVAIKVLPAAVADDPERLARFAREAQLLASLNHPNSAHVYGIEDGMASAPWSWSWSKGRRWPIAYKLWRPASTWRPTLVGPRVVRLKPDATYKEDPACQ